MSFNTNRERLLDRQNRIAEDSKTANESSKVANEAIAARMFGQDGAILVTGTSAVACGVTDKVFVAIQFLEDTVFASGAGGLSADSAMANKFPDDTAVSSDVSSNGAAIDSITFPKGMTLYGRYDGFTLASGKVIAYVG